MSISVSSFYRVPKIRDKIHKDSQNLIKSDTLDVNSNNLSRLKNVEVRVEKLNFVGLSSFMVKIIFGKNCYVKLKKLKLNDVNLKVKKSLSNAKKDAKKVTFASEKFGDEGEANSDDVGKKKKSSIDSVTFAGDSEVNLIIDLDHIKQLASPFKSVNGDVVTYIQDSDCAVIKDIKRVSSSVVHRVSKIITYIRASKSVTNYGLGSRKEIENDDEDCPKKEIPSWALDENLSESMESQSFVRYEDIFSPCDTPNLREMFPNSKRKIFETPVSEKKAKKRKVEKQGKIFKSSKNLLSEF